MKAVLTEYLKTQFGSRVSFRPLERKLYGHDIAAMPDLIKPLVGSTIPDAVVQPQSETELIDLVRWAASNRVALTPRGKSTSGYGGALPVKKGIVVDFYRMNRVLSIDTAAQTVVVQPGMVWEKLDAELVKHGLTLRQYPSSYPSSTVGGWLAQGGAGIGSYAMGYFRDSVSSARVVLPDGAVKEFIGADIDLISDAEGITGLISAVTLRLKPLEELEIKAIGCADVSDLQCLIMAMVAEKLPLWSVTFINPQMAELKNRLPSTSVHGQKHLKSGDLPSTYLMTLAYRKADQQNVAPALIRLAAQHGAELLSDEIALHEWDNRFKVMAVKRLGPSMVPSEVVVPLSRLSEYMEKVHKEISQTLVKEATIVCTGNGEPEAVILGFIPADQRRFSYNLIFGLVLTTFKIAGKCGGRPYSTGLYWAAEAGNILGQARVKRLVAYKNEVDPHGILNPGKVISGGIIGVFMGLARSLEPLIRPIGNSITLNVGERPAKAVRGIPADVVWYAYSCSQCGYCVDECDQFYGRGWESQSPRGKWYWLREYMEGREQWEQFMVDSILACTTCELCNHRCSESLPIEPSWMKLRGKLINEDHRMTFPPFEMMAAALRKEGDIWAGYRRNRNDWFPADMVERHGPGHRANAVYFAGCTAAYVENDISMASVRLLDAAGVDFTSLGSEESCCGTPMLAAGKWDVFAEVLKKNIAAVKNSGSDTVITSCPACDMMWRHVYPEWARKLGIEYGITTKHYSEVVTDKLKTGNFSFPNNGHSECTVTWHDSCHIGRASGVFEPPRDLIKAIPGVKFVEMEHNREDAHCCGSVLTLIKDPAVAADVGKVRLDEAADVGAQKIVALCPCCEFQLRVSAENKHSPVEVVDLARFAASALGYEFPDPNPEVAKQWAVFEAMISLMTPQGFADLMSTMWPELIDAMPLGMGRMMRLMGKMPGILEVMKPLFPFLFPRLLPMMMPKVMPTMLQRVGERVPMPDYMAEQMPELMPGIMSNLMPHMIGDVVPLITQPMIDYLRGKSTVQR